MTLADQLAALGALQQSTASLATKLFEELPAVNLGDQLNALSALQSGTAALCAAIAGELPANPTAPARPRSWPAAASALPAKIAADPMKPSIWAQVIAAAELSIASPTQAQAMERMACSAALYRFGLIPGATYHKAQADYGAQAVADLTAINFANAPAVDAQLDLYILQIAWTYDAIFPLLSTAQRQAFVQGVAAFRAAVKGTAKVGNSAQPGWETWWGYNQLAGAIMLLDLACEDGTLGWVADTFANSWWANDPVKPNFYFTQKCFPQGTNREGCGYWSVGGADAVEFAKSAYAALTGDHSADDLNPNRYPLWYLFQSDPNFVKGQFAWTLPTVTYSGGPYQTERIWCERLGIETGNGDQIRAPLARWMLDQTVGWGGGTSDSPTKGLISYLLIGDPRVVGQSPAALNLPLSFNTTSEVFQRSDWSTAATVLYFGCAPYVTRTTPTNDLMLWSKGQPLLCQRQRLYGHSYGCGAFRNLVSYWQGNQIVGQMPNDADETYLVKGVLTQNADGSWTGDATKLISNLQGVSTPLPPISKSVRTVAFLAGTSIVTVTDDVACDASLTPHVIWNTPNAPAMSLAGQAVTFASGQSVQADSVTLTNGAASCVMTFGGPVTIIPIGGADAAGVRHWVDGLDGQPMDVSGKPTTVPAYDSIFLGLTPAQQVKQGGYWRFHVVLPAGGAKLTTTIQVQ